MRTSARVLACWGAGQVHERRNSLLFDGRARDRAGLVYLGAADAGRREVETAE